MTDLFNAPTDDTPQGDDPITVDQLVGEDKQYKTVDELAKAKRHADSFIEQLKSELSGLRNENTSLRDDASTRERLDTILDQLNTRQQSQDDEDFEGSNNQESPPRSSQPDTQQINALIESRLTEIERERTANQNRIDAINKIKDVYGNDYVSRLEQRTQELGLTKDEMNSLAGRSPNAFLALVAPTTNNDDRPVSVPRSSVNPGNPTSDPQAGTADFYKRLKQTDPQKYWSPKVQNQLHKDAIRAANEGRSFDIA